MHHIFVNEKYLNMAEKTVNVLFEDDFYNYNHLVKSLRINEGELVLCSIIPFESTFDYLCKVEDITEKKVTLRILEETKSRELPIKVNLYQGISKLDKFEFIIEKSVELGINSIIPLDTDYCITKIDDKKSDKKLERFNKIAKSAAEQSKRHIIPEVLKPITFNTFLNNVNENDKNIYNLLFYENAKEVGGIKRIVDNIKKGNNQNTVVNLIIGPEGGFSNGEIDKAKNKGLNILSLGERILRTETASVAAMAILMYDLEQI